MNADVPDDDPDVRFTYANERTFLAWNRTALALVTAGLAITQLLPPFDLPGGRRLIGLPLIALGTISAFLSYRHWLDNEQAMREHKPLPSSPLPRLLAAVVCISAAIAFVLAAFFDRT
jgi:putative membrane protein